MGARLALVAKICKNLKDEVTTKAEAIVFIKNIEKVIKSTGASLLAVEDIEKAISYAGDESPSIKVILEHLALVL